jgi:hypothetical protein
VAGKIRKKIGSDSSLVSQITPEILLKKSKKELIELILCKDDMQIPVSIFLNNAGPLECLVKYLKDEKKLKIKTISQRLNRNVQTIWATYRNIKNKKFAFKEEGCKAPLRIFSKDDKSILESLVFYLKNSEKLRFCDISKILRRDSRTVWIYYRRYIEKTEKNNRGRKNGEQK